jgi:hypothetical protein
MRVITKMFMSKPLLGTYLVQPLGSPIPRQAEGLSPPNVATPQRARKGHTITVLPNTQCRRPHYLEHLAGNAAGASNSYLAARTRFCQTHQAMPSLTLMIVSRSVQLDKKLY